MLLGAERPVIFVGQAIRHGGAAGELLQLAERLQIPVAASMSGLGAIDTLHPLSLGMVARGGHYQANHATRQADVLLSLGAGAQDGLAQAFADVEELASACRFADCAHRSEPGCAVLASVWAGDVGQDRVDAWRRLQRELAYEARRNDARLRVEHSRRWKAIAREQRSRGGRP